MNGNDNILRAIYYDQKNPASFSSSLRLYKAAKEINPNITHSIVKDWLSGEFTYTLHKPLRKKFLRNPIIVEDIDQQWEADLVDMQEFQSQNDNYKYILTVIDVLSKYAWVVPLKDKSAKSIVEAFKIILQGNRKPFFIRTDQGKEFVNQNFKRFIKPKDIHHFTSKNTDIKCAIVERFNRTLKGRMFKYFTSKGTRRYIDILQDLVDAYNSSYHRSIKMRPIDANDSKVLFKNLYGVSTVEELYDKRNNDKDLEEADIVRKKYKVGVFDKSFYPNWTDQTFEIDAKTDAPVKPLYKIKDEQQNVIDQRFYPEEVQKIKENLYRVEKVIRKRKYRGKTQCLVKWLNYPDSYNSWIDESELLKL
jgi:hypothetical protein